MKKVKKICLMVALIFCVSALTNSFIFAKEGEIDLINTNNEVGAYEEESSPNYRLWFNVFKLAFKIADHFIVEHYHEAYTDVFHDGTGNYTYALSTIAFNNYADSGFGGTATKDILVTETGQVINMWASSNHVFPYPMRLNLMRAPSDTMGSSSKFTVDVYGADIYSYTIPSYEVGSYFVGSYSTTDKTSWNLSLRFDHFTADRYGVMPASIPVEEKDNSINYSVDGITYTQIGNRIFSKPVDLDGSTIETRFDGKMIDDKNKIVSFGELNDEFYYSHLNAYLDVPKTYVAYDTIRVEDKILDLYYDEDTDETFFGFDFSSEEEIQIKYIAFRGNLQEAYKINQEIQFEFNLLPVENSEFVIIDYNNDFKKMKKAPKINKYVVK